MLPLIYRITFPTPAIAYLVALALVVYMAWSGWRSARGPDNTAPTPEMRRNNAMNMGLMGAGLALLGLWYATDQGTIVSSILGPPKREGIPLHTYGILIGVGFMSAVAASAWIAQREWPGELGLKRRDQIFDMAFILFVGGIVGARVLYSIVNWKEGGGLSSLFSLSGGLVFQGGLAGAAIAAWWYCRKHGIEFLRLLDFGLPAVSLGAAFGRLGCFSAGCCWGKVLPADSPLAVRFPGTGLVKNLFGGAGDTASLAYQSMSSAANETRWVLESTGELFPNAVPGAVRVSEWVQQHHHTLPLHPTQLYESLAQIALFAIFVFARRYRRFHGQIAGMWLMVYAIERSTVELFRGDLERGTLAGALKGSVSIDPQAWYNISTSQLGSMVIFAFGAGLLVRQWRLWKGQQPQTASVPVTA